MVKTFQMGETTIAALNDVSIDVEKGEFVAITGPSGSGKTTLMNLIGCLDQPTSGEYLIDGQNVAHMERDNLARIRNKKIGFVFQTFNLIASLTARENIELPMIFDGRDEEERRKRSNELLKRVGLEERAKNKPPQLSGGERQRISLVRSLVLDPQLLLLDEPLANIDQPSREYLREDLFRILKNSGRSIIYVTHELIRVTHDTQATLTHNSHTLIGCEL